LWTFTWEPTPPPISHDPNAATLARFYGPLHFPRRNPLHLALLRNHPTPTRIAQTPRLDAMPALRISIQGDPIQKSPDLPAVRRKKRIPSDPSDLIPQKNCPPRAVPKQFPFPKIRVDDRIPSNQTSNEGLSSRRAPSLRDFIQHRSGTSLRLIANTEGQIRCSRSRENFSCLVERTILENQHPPCLSMPL
jgi:hypothetical protein